MKRFYSYILTAVFSLALLLLIGCQPVSEPIPPSLDGGEPPAENGGDSYTLLVYVCGSDLESRFGAASNNIAEMQEATLGEGVNVLIQTGGAKRWQDVAISAMSTDRYLITSGKKQLVDRNTVRQNFGESKTLSDFIKFGVAQYPADKYGLILWNHGAGSLGGVCFDACFGNDALTLPELGAALADAKEALGKKFEFIGFDACLMATYDTASLLAPYAGYMIASEESEPSSGWDYSALISALGTDTFYTDVLHAYAQKQSKRTTYTLSAINLSQMSKADEVVNGIAEQIRYDVAQVGAALASGKEFGTSATDTVGSNLFDLGLLADALGIPYSFDGFITRVGGAAHADATGMSLYFPTEKEALVENYRAICPNERYAQLLSEYFSYRPETPIAFERRGFENDGRLSFSLTAASGKYVQSVGYELHSLAGSEQTKKLYALGRDNDVVCEGGIYTVNFHGEWVFLNEMLLHTDVYEEKQGHTVFSAPVKVNGELCRLLFTYFGATQSFLVEGYVIEGDLSSRIHDLCGGEEITVIYEDPTAKDDRHYYEEGVFVWDESTSLSLRRMEAGYYQCIPVVTDIYGNAYYGYTAIVYFDGERTVIDEISAG